MLRLCKTGTYWLCHITVAFGLAFLLTGNWHAALAIGLLEPSVQALVFYLHEVAWDRARSRSAEVAARPALRLPDLWRSMRLRLHLPAPQSASAAR